MFTLVNMFTNLVSKEESNEVIIISFNINNNFVEIKIDILHQS